MEATAVLMLSILSSLNSHRKSYRLLERSVVVDDKAFVQSTRRMTATDMSDAATMTTAMAMEEGSSSPIMLITNSRNISRDIKMEAIPDNNHDSNSSRHTTMAMKIML